jgi:hypothetical protein
MLSIQEPATCTEQMYSPSRKVKIELLIAKTYIISEELDFVEPHVSVHKNSKNSTIMLCTLEKSNRFAGSRL